MKRIIVFMTLCMFSLVGASKNVQPAANVPYYDLSPIVVKAAKTAPYSTLTLSKKEVECLARNVYFEARGEGPKGMLAVAFVTLNRLKARYQPTVCGVVNQVGQFTWDRTLKVADWDDWKASVRVAGYALNNYGLMADPTRGSLYYHEKTIEPVWAADYKQTLTIGNHIFYKVSSDHRQERVRGANRTDS